MLSFEENMNKFFSMSYDQKKRKLLNMLEYVKDNWSLFKDLYKLLNSVESINEEFLDNMYKIIVKAMYRVKEDKLKESLEEIENLRWNLKNIKEKEEKKQEKDKNDADSLLDEL